MRLTVPIAFMNAEEGGVDVNDDNDVEDAAVDRRGGGGVSEHQVKETRLVVTNHVEDGEKKEGIKEQMEFH